MNKESAEQIVIREGYYWDLEILLDLPTIVLVPKVKPAPKHPQTGHDFFDLPPKKQIAPYLINITISTYRTAIKRNKYASWNPTNITHFQIKFSCIPLQRFASQSPNIIYIPTWPYNHKTSNSHITRNTHITNPHKNT